jgi:hypothetical protein
MEDLVERLTRGNAAEVKVVIASVIAALAVYQLALIAVGYGKVRPPFLSAGPASRAHRASGDAIVALTAVVAAMCLAVYGFGEDDAGLHMITGTALLVALAVKVAVVRWGKGLGRFLPLIGLTVFALIAVTWASSAGDFLAER